MQATILLASLLANFAGVVGRAPAPAGAASTFVHLFEWSWSDIAKECEDWLGPKGFKAVQVSPPTEHIKGPQWYTRYQPVTYNLTSRSGTEEAFKDMVQRCKKVNVDIYVDAVINHVATGTGVGIAGSPYGHRTTGIYGQEDFHHLNGDLSTNCGIDNYNDKHQVQYCDLVALPDLCTGCPRVQTVVAQYLTTCLEMGVAGFRIDAAKHMEAGELKALLEKVKGGIPYLFTEVIKNPGEPVLPEMYEGMGQVTEFRYARQLAPNILNEGKLKYLDTFGSSWGFIASRFAVVFMDNHDTQRHDAILTYKNGALYALANVFMLAHPFGYPKVMSSYGFDDTDMGPPDTPVHGSSGLNCFNGPWVCEHRWPQIANMVAWRRSAGDNDELQSFMASGDGNGAFFCRGNSACVALNRASSSWTVTVKTTLPAGTYHDVLRASDVASCPTVEVRDDGSADIVVPSIGAVAFHIHAADLSKNPGVHGGMHALQIVGISVVVLLVAASLVLGPRAWRRRQASARSAATRALAEVELSPQSERRREEAA